LRDRILKRAARSETVTAEIHEIARAEGLDLALARTLDPAMLLLWLAPSAGPDPGRMWLMAELLYLEGLHGKTEEAPSWRGDLERALAIFERLPSEWSPGESFDTAGERASEIADHLSRTAG
jgi:hypothetical protein